MAVEKIMTNKKFADICLHVANDCKTLYVNGGFGRNLTAENKQYYLNGWSYNRGLLRKPKIQNATADTYGFDCICFIKAIRMGWNGNTLDPKCGVNYVGAWDVTDELMLNECSDVSSDFSKIDVGEMLWMSGHAGVYVGQGFAVECTPSWKDGVQVTAVANIGKPVGYNSRKWTKHGKLPWVDYSRQFMTTMVPVLQQGMIGEDVKYLQLILNQRGSKLEIDGSFGPATRLEVTSFQKRNGLDTDGSVGPITWSALLGRDNK